MLRSNMFKDSKPPYEPGTCALEPHFSSFLQNQAKSHKHMILNFDQGQASKLVTYK